jgi:hypothetical protein
MRTTSAGTKSNRRLIYSSMHVQNTMWNFLGQLNRAQEQLQLISLFQRIFVLAPEVQTDMLRASERIQKKAYGDGTIGYFHKEGM